MATLRSSKLTIRDCKISAPMFYLRTVSKDSLENSLNSNFTLKEMFTLEV